jgi:circadian clock protein KaiB
MVEFKIRLYVSGDTIISRKAKENLARLCEGFPQGAVATRVIDVLAEPGAAEEARILATPTLIYEHPTRPKRIIGDLSDMRRVLDFLGIEASSERI